MGVAAAKSVFHQPGIAGPENLRAPVAHADLHFALQVDNQASLWQRVEVHGPQLGELVDPDPRDLHQRAQLGVLRHMDFFHMAFTIGPGIDTVDAHTTSLCRGVLGSEVLDEACPSRMWSLVCAGASTLGVEGQMVEEEGNQRGFQAATHPNLW